MSLGGVAEISNLIGSDPEHKNGTIVTAGVPTVLSALNNKIITFVLIRNPNRGPNGNTSATKVLLFSIDGGTAYMSLNRGETLAFPGNVSNLTVDAAVNGTNYEIILWSTPED